MVSKGGNGDGGEDSALGHVYWFKLRRLLSWPESRIWSKRLLGLLPLSFLEEHVLLIERLERHEDALRPTPKIRPTPTDEAAYQGGRR